MNENKLSAMMRFRYAWRKNFKVVGNLHVAARFRSSDTRIDKLSGAARKRADWNRPRYPYKFKNKPVVMMLVNVRLPQVRVKRGNPARNPTALT